MSNFCQLDKYHVINLDTMQYAELTNKTIDIRFIMNQINCSLVLNYASESEASEAFSNITRFTSRKHP